MKKRLFNYDRFAQKNNKDKKEDNCIKEYEQMYCIGRGSIIEQHPFYREYLSKFDTCFELVTPDDVEMEPHEWDLLIRLVMGSFSSSYYLELDEEWKLIPSDKIKVHLRICTKSEGEPITKLVEELFTFQIERLFEIYVQEQIKLQILKNKQDVKNGTRFDPFSDDDDEDIIVKQKRDEKCYKCKEKINQLLSDAEFYQKISGII